MPPIENISISGGCAYFATGRHYFLFAAQRDRCRRLLDPCWTQRLIIDSVVMGTGYDSDVRANNNRNGISGAGSGVIASLESGVPVALSGNL